MQFLKCYFREILSDLLKRQNTEVRISWQLKNQLFFLPFFLNLSRVLENFKPCSILSEQPKRVTTCSYTTCAEPAAVPILTLCTGDSYALLWD